jgi:hypothetical protein
MPDRDADNFNIVTMRDYVDRLLEDITRHYDVRLEAVSDATARALAANEKRLDSMNEFRETLRDQANRLATRQEVEQIRDQMQRFLTLVEYSARHEKVMSDIESLKISRATLDGKASQNAVNSAQVTAWIGLVVGVLGLLFALLKIFVI